jgi:predicted transcriptional regulator
MRTFDPPAKPLGSLEEKVMGVLWRRSPLAVRDVCRLLPGDHEPAYTTVMTTLDRLFKKGLLDRHKDGLAFVYEPAMSRDEHRRRIVEQTLSGLIMRKVDVDPVLAAFVDAAAEVDDDNLRRLEVLIAERRRRGR